MPAISQDLLLSEDLKKVVKIAQSMATESMHPEFAPAHLLKALLHQEAGLHPLLETLEQDVYYLEEWAEVRMEGLPRKAGLHEAVSGSPLIAEVLNEADNIRLHLLKEAIEPE